MKQLYDATLQSLLQLMNGECFLSQGGIDRVDFMLRGIDINNKIVLDFGSGLGGPAFYLAEKYQSSVIGIDIDPDLIAQASIHAKQKVLNKVSFITSNTLPLPINQDSIDIVFSKESIVHVEDKIALFKEFKRVLRPGGYLIILDWFWKGWEPSEDLLKCLHFDSYGSKMHYVTIDQYLDFLRQSGFDAIEWYNTSSLHLNDIRYELDLLYKDRGEQIKQQFGATMLTDCRANWNSHKKILASGELETYLIRIKY